MSEEKKHALLSASAAARWLACPPSVRATESLPDTGSEYAAEGSLAHAIAELKLNKNFIELMGTRALNNRIKKLAAAPEYQRDGKSLYQEEMLRHTDTYLDYVKRVALAYPERPYIAVEKRVDFSAYVPEGFGTCDCILIGGTTMHVIDFKYGKGVPVSAEKNPQMMLYALGALGTYGILYPVETVMLAIVQPRLDSISEWSLTAAELMEWGEKVVKPTAKLAFDGGGEFTPGDHCRFCKIRGGCRARTEEAFAMIPLAQKPPAELTPEETAEALAKAEFLQAWAKDLQEQALASLLAGAEIPGWKAVHGRAIRRWTDQEAAFAAIIESGLDEALLYERKPLTLAAVEKVMGKAAFADAAGKFVETPPGKPALAPESDKRPAIKGGVSAEEAFRIVSNE